MFQIFKKEKAAVCSSGSEPDLSEFIY